MPSRSAMTPFARSPAVLRRPAAARRGVCGQLIWLFEILPVGSPVDADAHIGVRAAGPARQPSLTYSVFGMPATVNCRSATKSAKVLPVTWPMILASSAVVRLVIAVALPSRVFHRCGIGGLPCPLFAAVADQCDGTVGGIDHDFRHAGGERRELRDCDRSPMLGQVIEILGRSAPRDRACRPRRVASRPPQ